MYGNGLIIDNTNISPDNMMDNILTDPNKINDLLNRIPNVEGINKEEVKANISVLLSVIGPVDQMGPPRTPNPLADASKHSYQRQQAVRKVLQDTYGNTPLNDEHGPITVNEIMTKWINDAIDDQLIDIFKVINTRASQELLTVGSDLGTTFANQLYDDTLVEEGLEPNANYEVSKANKHKQNMAERELKTIETVSQQFDIAWKKALNGDLTELRALLTAPADTTKAPEMRAYTKKLTILRNMGINTTEIKSIIEGAYGAEPAKVADALKSAQAKLKLIERNSNYSKKGKDYIDLKKRELKNTRIIDAALTEHDTEFLNATNRANDAIIKAESFANKYLAILKLANPPTKFTEKQIKQILEDLARGNTFRLTAIPELNDIHFSEQDRSFISTLVAFVNKPVAKGAEPDKVLEKIKGKLKTPQDLASLTRSEVCAIVTKWVEDQGKDLNDITKKGKDARNDPQRTEKLDKAKKPKQVRNRISLIRRMFKNIKIKDELDKEEQARLESLGRNKVKDIENLDLEAVAEVANTNEEHSA